MRGVLAGPRGGQPKSITRVSPAAYRSRPKGEGRHHGSQPDRRAVVARRRAANRRARAARKASR